MQKQIANALFILSAAFALLATGCALFQTAAPVAVPAVTCFIIEKEPLAMPYLRGMESAIRRFSAGTALDANSLRNALIAVPVGGVKPYIVSGAYTVVVVAYGSVLEKYATAPDREPQLRAALVAIADGIAAGVSQCGRASNDDPVGIAAPKGYMTEDLLNKLARAMERSLKDR